MTVVLLAPGMSMACAPGGLEVEWHCTGPEPSTVDVRVQPDGPIGEHPPRLHALGPRRLLLAAVSAPVSIVVGPVGGATHLPEGTTVEVQLTTRARDGDIDQIVLNPTDVSAMHSAVVCTIEPAANAWTVSAVQPADRTIVTSAGPAASSTTPYPDAGPPTDTQLPATSMARRAAYATRRLQPPDRPVRRATMAVAVDWSASMSEHFRTGAVQSMLEVLLGINLVVGNAPELPVWLAGATARRSGTDLDHRTVDGYAQTLVNQRPFASGTSLASLVERVGASPQPATVVVVTDGVPHDLAAAARRLGDHGAALAWTRWHLLAFARGPDDPDVRDAPWRNELAMLHTVADRLPVSASAITPDEDEGWLARELEAPPRLDAVVGAIGAWQFGDGR